MHRSPLRVGLLLDSWLVRDWVARIVDELESAPWADIRLVVLNAASAPRRGALERLWRQRRHLLYLAYTRLDRRVMRRQPDPFAVRDLESVLFGRTVLRVLPERSEYSDYFPPAALEDLRAHDLDVVLRFGFRILRGPVLGVARYGIWSYHHGDEREQRGGPPGF